MRNNIARFTEYPIDDKWRFSVDDEPNDIVLRVEFFGTDNKPGKWECIARIEQSKHEEFHAHLPGIDKRITIGLGLDTVGKLNVGFDKLKEYASQGLIYYKNHVFSPSESWNEIKKTMVEKLIPKGSTRNTKSITGTAKIKASLSMVVMRNGETTQTKNIDSDSNETNVYY